MNNIYITRIKDRLNNFHKFCEDTREQMQRNTLRYISSVAEEENRKLESSMMQQYESAKASFIQAFRDIRTAYSIATMPNIDSVSGERVFFNCEFPLTFNDNELILMSELHPRNYTWQRFLLDYIDRRNRGKDAFQFVNARRVIESRTPISILSAYKTVYEGAISLLESILNDAPNVPLMIDAYMDKDYSEELLKTIGDGLEIDNFLAKANNMPESALHLLDYVQIA